MKQIFVAATRQNDGKTTFSLGLFNALQKRYDKIGYMKPVGQQYVMVNDKRIDKDAFLFHKEFNLKDRIELTSPIAVPKGFTQDYIDHPDRVRIHDKILTARDELSVNKDVILYEGTGHAGVGSVFEASNADTAKLLGSKVILVTVGGIGKSIDEIMMNAALFKEKGVDILGVVINKVLPEKYDKIKDYTTRGFNHFGIDVLGVMPLMTQLTRPTIASIVDELNPDVLSGDCGFNNMVNKFMIGDMIPHFALDKFTAGTLMIVPGNREGVILTALTENLMHPDSERQVAGIIFTDDVAPHPKLLSLLQTTTIPLLKVKQDAFTVATQINNVIFKIRAEESEKIAIAEDMVEQYVDVDRICGAM